MLNSGQEVAWPSSLSFLLSPHVASKPKSISTLASLTTLIADLEAPISGLQTLFSSCSTLDVAVSSGNLIVRKMSKLPTSYRSTPNLTSGCENAVKVTDTDSFLKSMFGVSWLSPKPVALLAP